jgi:hypothetical protein
LAADSKHIRFVVPEQSGRADAVTASGVKRLRPISSDVRRSTKVNRDLLYEPDEHLKRDAEFPPMRGKRGSGVGSMRLGSDRLRRCSRSAHSREVGVATEMLLT